MPAHPNAQARTRTPAAEAKAAAGLNPRDSVPYKRGPYNTDRGSSATAALAKETRAATAAAAAAANPEVVTLRAKVKELESKVIDLKYGNDLAVKNAQLQAEKGLSDKLLDKYREGMRDAASLLQGNIPGSTGSAPGSAL